MARGVVVLDLMDTVLVDPFFADAPRRLGMRLDEIVTALDPEAWVRFESGEYDESQYLARLFRAGPVQGLDPQRLRRILIEGFRFVEGMAELLVDLRGAGVPLYALSNYTPWIEHPRRALGLDVYFDQMFVSCYIGHRKPSHRAFAAVLEKIGRRPGECLFVDDRLTNIDAARSYGMPVHHFRGAGPLRAELEERGLLDSRNSGGRGSRNQPNLRR